MGVAAVRKFCHDAEILRQRFPRPPAANAWVNGGSVAEGAACAFYIVELNDIWAFFCRTLTLDLATGFARDFSGNVIPSPAPFTYKDSLALVKNKRGYEPKWHNATDTFAAIDKLAPPKAGQLKLALGAATSPAPDINTARNYIAHRRSDCADKLMAATFYEKRMALDPFRVGNFLRADGRTIFDFWIDELSLIAFACLN